MVAVVLEEEAGLLRLDSGFAEPGVESVSELVELIGGEVAEGGGEACLNGRGGALEEFESLRRDGDLGSAGIIARGAAHDEAVLHEPGDDDGNGALVREGALSEFVDGLGGSGGELLQDEELCAADADVLLDRAAGDAEGADDLAHCVEGAGDVESGVG